MGYHKRAIKFAGKFGTLDKILEEVDEAAEAKEQGNPIMFLLELSDVYLALKGVAERNGTTMENLRIMSEATERAFASGARQPKPDSKPKDDLISGIPVETRKTYRGSSECPDKNYHQYIGTYDSCDKCGLSH